MTILIVAIVIIDLPTYQKNLAFAHQNIKYYINQKRKKRRERNRLRVEERMGKHNNVKLYGTKYAVPYDYKANGKCDEAEVLHLIPETVM